MKKIITCLCLGMVLLLGACGGSKHDNSKFAGSFTDEFGNKFVLNEDYTGTLQMDKSDKVDSIKWFDGTDHKRAFVTITYNGDPTYYYLRDGKLYRHEEDMDNGSCAINITYDN